MSKYLISVLTLSLKKERKSWLDEAAKEYFLDRKKSGAELLEKNEKTGGDFEHKFSSMSKKQSKKKLHR